jgi:hypothetical protein
MWAGRRGRCGFPFWPRRPPSRESKMSVFKIVQHNDLHGDAICFCVVDNDGHEHGRFPSEIEAIDWHLYLEALAEYEMRFPQQELEDDECLASHHSTA